MMPSLLGLPYDAGSSFLRGPAKAPAAIRNALHSSSSNSWTESIRDVGAPSSLSDAGDLRFGDDPRETIEHGVRDLLATGARPILLGGDHSVSYPALRSIRAVHPRLTILHIDAHTDLYENFEGDRYSHACPFARIMEEGLTDRLVQVGIRTLTADQASQATRYGVEIVTMRDWSVGARPTVDGPVYLSLDIDALDPAFAPGVSHWEPGGLSVRDVLTVIQGMGGTLIGADVVELNPDRDPTGVTAYVAAKFVKEIADRMLEDDNLEVRRHQSAL